MPQRSGTTSNLMRPFVVLALPGMYLLYKYNQYRQQQMETARRRVTERELMHLNTKISDKCSRAWSDIPPPVDPICPDECKRRVKKPGILHKIKLRIVEGGTNFGTPFRRLKPCPKPICKEVIVKEPELPEPKKKDMIPIPEPREGVQVSILGADTAIGQYVSLLLKQCPCIKKLRLYEARDSSCTVFNRDLCQIVHDLQHINTNCYVQAFSCACCDLERCLQNTDIVLMLESGSLNYEMSLEQRFLYQAPIVKHYADCIACECPKAFIIVCASPVDCMVPLVAQTLKETGWYNPQKLLGSLAGPEMRASTLAARALCLEPLYTRVPCVGGTEGEALVPLFSNAVEYFEFAADKLLNKLEENEPELATSPEEECVICVNAKATMQTSPCGHRVVCRRCFVKTIQMAVSQRLLPLRCVICRAKILRLRQAPRLVTSKSWQVSSSSGKTWGVPGSVSSYSVGARSVPASASLYSVTSGESSLSGLSSVSSNSGGTAPPCSTKLCGGSKCGGACLGAIPRPPPSTTPPKPRQPASNSLRRSQHHSMKLRLQEYQVHSYTGARGGEPSGRLPPIREFQREFREGRRESASATASTSTRIRCAQKIVTQLETSPQKNSPHFFRPLKPSNSDDPPISRDTSKETERKKENPKTKPKKDDKKKKDDDKPEDKNKKDENNDNRKNETAERKKEEKLRLKAEKEAKKEAKLLAKEEERQAKLLAKEEERQAKLLAKEEKKKAKKDAKLAAQAEKEKSK